MMRTCKLGYSKLSGARVWEKRNKKFSRNTKLTFANKINIYMKTRTLAKSAEKEERKGDKNEKKMREREREIVREK